MQKIDFPMLYFGKNIAENFDFCCFEQYLVVLHGVRVSFRQQNH
jgi:hypothetical protein